MVTLRYTEGEFLQLQEQMETDNYKSVSRYIRDRSLNRKVRITKEVFLTDKDLRRKVNALSARIGRVGVNYNQATKKFNQLCRAYRSDGSPVINTRAANYYLHQIHAMTKEIKDLMNKVIDTVDAMNFDNNPDSRGFNNNH